MLLADRKPNHTHNIFLHYFDINPLCTDFEKLPLWQTAMHVTTPLKGLLFIADMKMTFCSATTYYAHGPFGVLCPCSLRDAKLRGGKVFWWKLGLLDMVYLNHEQATPDTSRS